MTLMETAQLLGNFGEFIGALGVVITLFYLAVQVRHSKSISGRKYASAGATCRSRDRAIGR